MAHTSSAKKANRVSKRRHVFNVRRSRTMRSALKEVKSAISAKRTEEATAFLPKFYQAVDKAAKRGVIKKNAAARMKARVTKRLRASA